MAALPFHWKKKETPASWVTRSDAELLVPTDLVDQGNFPQTLTEHSGPSFPYIPAQHTQHLLMLATCLHSLFPLLSLGLNSARLCTNAHPGCVNTMMHSLKITDIDRALVHLQTHSHLL